MNFNFINISDINKYYLNICDLIIEEAIKNINLKDSFTFVLSGGKSPKYIFENLSNFKFKNIAWEKVKFFWVDERIITFDSIHSNYKLANDYFFKYINFCEKNIFKINITENITSIEKKYEDVIFSNVDQYLNDLPSFDLMLLGMGSDGHIASIFPDIPNSLSYRNVFSTTTPYNNFYRISMGFPIINNSNKIILLSNNSEKFRLLNQFELLLPVHKLNFKKTTIFTNEK